METKMKTRAETETKRSLGLVAIVVGSLALSGSFLTMEDYLSKKYQEWKEQKQEIVEPQINYLKGYSRIPGRSIFYKNK
jgi:hypothetical protein